MKEACDKCGTNNEKEGGTIVSCGKSFYLCHFCLGLIDHMPTGDVNSVENFMRDDGHELVSSPVSKNILLARMNRAKHQSPWCNGQQVTA